MSGRLADLPAEAWPAFSKLLDVALPLTVAEREAWLDQLPPGDASLRPFLENALRLDAEIRAANAPGNPRIVDDGAAADDEQFAFSAGQRIGPYQLAEPLGVGGMGEVWLAPRADGTLTRAVALKLPHTWLLSTGQRRRLARERDILAGLTHPNIAQLYDAGISAEGQPWLALEHIAGSHIDAHCRAQRLSIATRLQLFDQVLDAVQSAHARLIVHRDLKPANILVTAEGTVKLLDFGIAKLLDDGGISESTELTRLAGRAATPEYAAPEQLGDGAITVATDVYSLGVVLQELLCGQRPPPIKAGADAPEAPLASSLVLDAHAAQTAGLGAKQLRRALVGDLDAILAKALARDPRRRYASVERFADDLRRCRANEAIAARHITRIEQARRFLRRNRLAIGIATVFLMTVLGGAAASLWQAQRATQEARRANATRDFLLKVIGSSGKLQAQDREPGSTTIREMIDGIVDGADTGLREHPETRLELLSLAKQVYRQWYARERTVQAHEQYRQLVEQLHGAKDPRIIESLIEQASLSFDYADSPNMAALLEEAGQRIRAAGLEGSMLEAQWLIEMGRAETPAVGGSLQALDRFERAVAIHERLQIADRTRVWARFFLSRALAANDQPEAARALALRNIDIEQAKPAGSRNDWSIAWQTTQLGHYERALGHADAALAAYARAQALIGATFGRSVDTYQEALVWRATLLDWRGDATAARSLFEAEAAALAAEPADTTTDEGPTWVRLGWGRFLLAQGEAAAALPLLEAASKVEITSRPAAFVRADAQLSYGDALLAVGRRDEAAVQYEATRQAYAGFGHPEVEGALEAVLHQALFQLAQGDASAAAAGLDAVLANAGGKPHLAVAEARIAKAELAARRGASDSARQLRQQAQQDLDAVQAVVDPRRRAALQTRIDALAAPTAR